MTSTLQIASSLALTPRQQILERIHAAAAKAGRDPNAVTLIAVSKQQPWPKIATVLEEGQCVFGENRVQEAEARWRDRDDLELHLIGPLQTNKARDAVIRFQVIHTLDRPRLVTALARAVDAVGRCPALFIQVNTGEETQKAGVLPREAKALIVEAHRVFGAQLTGLMCIPPEAEPPGPHFALLAKIAKDHGLEELSMGMSGDFETAIRFGATHVRVGSALFGERAQTSMTST